MLKFFISAVLLMTLAACGPRYVDFFPYHDDGTLKPRLAIIPLTDLTDCDLPWDISCELTESLRENLKYSGEIYVLSQQEVSMALEKSRDYDYFGRDLSFVENFGNTDFVVAMELIQHDIISYENWCLLPQSSALCPPSGSVLMTKIRLKVFDVREDCPRTVLHEIFTCSHAFSQRDEVKIGAYTWGSQDYEKSPCCIAHRKMICDLSKRLEEVTWRCH